MSIHLFCPLVRALARRGKFAAAWLVLSGACVRAETPVAAPWLELGLLARTGYDSDARLTGGSATETLGGRETFVFAAGATVGVSRSRSGADGARWRLGYAGEAVRFAQLADENFSAHRLSASGQFSAGRWRFVGEGSSVIIAGGSETLPTCGAVNANALAVWRDRRENRQHRLKLQTEATAGAWVLRGSGTFLANDFHTRAVAGAFAFADRDDAVAGVDLGRRQAAGALTFFGVRRGRQNQAVVPLPGCEFDYSSDYSRVVAGWEGRLWSGVSMTFAAGPDFRRFTGAIDPRAMPGGRDRTSFWYEGGLVAKLAPEVTLTAKAAQMDWLSSTGKSAYVDSFGEAAITWTPRGTWSWRGSARVHRCDYFPVVRDDWEALLGVGATWTLPRGARLSCDVLHHRGWNTVSGVNEREFQRLAVTFGATIRL